MILRPYATIFQNSNQLPLNSYTPKLQCKKFKSKLVSKSNCQITFSDLSVVFVANLFFSDDNCNLFRQVVFSRLANGKLSPFHVNQAGHFVKICNTTHKQHGTAQHNTTQHNTTQHNTTKYNTTQRT